MSRPLLYVFLPTVIERMDLANRIVVSQKCPALRRTDQRCPADANTVEITTNSIKINNTSFQVEKYESGEHIEIFRDVDSKTVVLKTTVPLPEAKKKLFETIMKIRSGILKVKNLSILGDLNCFLPNLKLCVQNLKVAKPYTNFLEAYSEKQKKTSSLIVDLQKVLTADSFPLESFEMDYNFAGISNIPANTVITTRQQFAPFVKDGYGPVFNIATKEKRLTQQIALKLEKFFAPSYRLPSGIISPSKECLAIATMQAFIDCPPVIDFVKNGLAYLGNEIPSETFLKIHNAVRSLVAKIQAGWSMIYCTELHIFVLNKFSLIIFHFVTYG
ncbi:hypothetical protein L5515_003397 [Caenorhabditis briggsae]|uniref:Uncharacterized protein n=1 Tax=Caenorhabditis briggsae TaxID=6238 RepID=A0AAE9ELY9_CAEBR|nr:hypothetical protein L5515_003397 [Caenorhabditis briggsae]